VCPCWTMLLAMPWPIRPMPTMPTVFFIWFSVH
jgi:hypothetical protein